MDNKLIRLGDNKPFKLVNYGYWCDVEAEDGTATDSVRVYGMAVQRPTGPWKHDLFISYDDKNMYELI